MALDFLTLLNERVLVFDGAMGTNIDEHRLTVTAYGGPQTHNCPAWLCLTRPDVIPDIHRSFLSAGCDAVETSSFGGSRRVVAEFKVAEHVMEISRRAAQLAREAVAEFSTPDHPRFVIGSVGP